MEGLGRHGIADKPRIDYLCLDPCEASADNIIASTLRHAIAAQFVRNGLDSCRGLREFLLFQSFRVDIESGHAYIIVGHYDRIGIAVLPSTRPDILAPHFGRETAIIATGENEVMDEGLVRLNVKVYVADD